MTPDEIVRRYYDAFNARRFDQAQALLADDVQIEHHPIGSGGGTDSYTAFARRWLTAFPDGYVTIVSIHAMSADWYEVSLVGEGTHDGDFDMGPLGIIHATHRRGRLPFRHIFEIRDDRIRSSTLSFDKDELLRQLVR